MLLIETVSYVAAPDTGFLRQERRVSSGLNERNGQHHALSARTNAAFPRVPKLPKVRPPRLHQPTVHVTAMVGAVAIVSAVAATTPAPSGSLVRGGDPPGRCASATRATVALRPVEHSRSYGAPTTTTTVAPPPNTTVGDGPGNTQTVLFNDPNGNVQLASPLAGDGIPVTALEAYQNAANSANASHPNCHIPWPLLAGIGRVESDHGRYGGAVLRPDGTSTQPDHRHPAQRQRHRGRHRHRRRHDRR